MKVKTHALAFVTLLFVSGQSIATNYQIDTEGQHAFVTFKASHLGYSYVVGGFNEFEGQFTYDSGNPDASRVRVTIDASSLDTNHAERDKHLRGSKFFNVGEFPTISFESTGYLPGSDGDRLNGNLTMMGVTRAVQIDVRQIGEGKDPWGGYRSGFRGTVSLDSAEYGFPEWVGDVDVELNIEGLRI